MYSPMHSPTCLSQDVECFQQLKEGRFEMLWHRSCWLAWSVSIANVSTALWKQSSLEKLIRHYYWEGGVHHKFLLLPKHWLVASKKNTPTVDHSLSSIFSGQNLGNMSQGRQFGTFGKCWVGDHLQAQATIGQHDRQGNQFAYTHLSLVGQFYWSIEVLHWRSIQIIYRNGLLM